MVPPGLHRSPTGADAACVCGGVRRILSECGIVLGASALQRLLTPAEFEAYLSTTLEQLVEHDETLTRCPNSSCGVPLECAGIVEGALLRPLGTHRLFRSTC